MMIPRVSENIFADMNMVSPIFAYYSTGELIEVGRHLKSNSWTSEVAIVCGAILLLTFFLIIWAAFIRKPKRRRVRVEKTKSISAGAGVGNGTNGQAQAVSTGSSHHRRHRKRKRRREHRPRNPTLAETGGLPPIRPEEPLT
jgi:hypothetical protein